MGVADPLRTELDRNPWDDLFGEDPSADPLVGLQHQRRESGFEHSSGGDHPRNAGSDDDDVRFMACWMCHEHTLSRAPTAG